MLALTSRWRWRGLPLTPSWWLLTLTSLRRLPLPSPVCATCLGFLIAQRVENGLQEPSDSAKDNRQQFAVGRQTDRTFRFIDNDDQSGNQITQTGSIAGARGRFQQELERAFQQVARAFRRTTAALPLRSPVSATLLTAPLSARLLIALPASLLRLATLPAR